MMSITNTAATLMYQTFQEDSFLSGKLFIYLFSFLIARPQHIHHKQAQSNSQ